MNPYQPGEDNQDPYEVGYKAGAASRDADVVSLTNQRDYEYVRAENAEQERAQFEQESDQLREHVTMLRDALLWHKEHTYNQFEPDNQCNAHKRICEALAVTEVDLDGLILCEKEPVTPLSGRAQPLYRARRPE